MRQSTISGNQGTRYPVAETLWILAGIVLLLAFGDSLALLILAFAIVTVAAAWGIHRRVDHRVGSKGHAMTMVLPVLFAAAGALTAVLALAAPAQAASIDSRFDICAALRNGTSLATIETTLEARGYSASNAGALTGTTIRQQCPDQAAGVMAQITRQRG
jgi:hypothetical protein